MKEIDKEFHSKFGDPALDVPSEVTIRVVEENIRNSSRYMGREAVIELIKRQYGVLVLAHELGHHFDPNKDKNERLWDTLVQLNTNPADDWRYGLANIGQLNRIAQKLRKLTSTVSPEDVGINFTRGIYGDVIALEAFSRLQLAKELEANKQAIELVKCSAWPLEAKELAIKFFKLNDNYATWCYLYKDRAFLRDFVERIKTA